MNKGQLVVMLLAVMIVMTLVSQNLKRVTPLVQQFAQLRQQPQPAADSKLLKQLGAQDLQSPQYQQIQNVLNQLAGALPAAQAGHTTAPATPREDASLFKDWVNSAIAQTQPAPKTQAALPTQPKQPQPETKPFLQITQEFPPQITNPNFTSRQLRSARIRLREMRLNYQETADDVGSHFGAQAKVALKQISAQAEQKAAHAAQTAKNWPAFEKQLEKINANYESRLKDLLRKYIK